MTHEFGRPPGTTTSVKSLVAAQTVGSSPAAPGARGPSRIVPIRASGIEGGGLMGSKFHWFRLIANLELPFSAGTACFGRRYSPRVPWRAR